eukprot:764948-Hanusia_phi.AAC.2
MLSAGRSQPHGTCSDKIPDSPSRPPPRVNLQALRFDSNTRGGTLQAQEQGELEGQQGCSTPQHRTLPHVMRRDDRAKTSAVVGKLLQLFLPVPHSSEAGSSSSSSQADRPQLSQLRCVSQVLQQFRVLGL